MTPTDVLVERVRELLIAWGTHLHKYREREDALNDLASLAARIRELEGALVDLHESLFIGSERGLSKETLREMATFAKTAAEKGSGSDA